MTHARLKIQLIVRAERRAYDAARAIAATVPTLTDADFDADVLVAANAMVDARFDRLASAELIANA